MSENIFVFADHLVTGSAFFKLRDRISLIIDRGFYEVYCAHEAHAHYGDKFNSTDVCLYFIHGALSEIFSKV